MERLWTSNDSISNGNRNCLIGKSLFAINLPLQFFHATVANDDIESFKSFNTFLKKLFVPYASEIWTKSYGPTYSKFWALWQNIFFITIFDKDTILEDVSVTQIIF